MIEKHTDGQLLLLTEGLGRWQKLINAEAEKRSKESSKGSTSSGKTVGKHRKLKPPKFTSVNEHNEWMAKNRVVGI